MYSQTDSQAEVRELAARLYADKRTYLLHIAARNVNNDADAEEALHEAFASFIGSFDPNGGAPPLAWLTTTLKRACWARYREKRLDRSAGQESKSNGDHLGAAIESIPARASGPEQLIVQVDEARARLAQLKPDQRTALVLRAAGFSYNEIGARRGWTYTKVNRCISEGRAALRRGQRAK